MFLYPPKYDIFGVGISATAYDQMLDILINAAKERISICITHLAVHGLIEGSNNREFRKMLNDFEIVAPDGQPVRFALHLLYKVYLPDRCYGPEFMIRACERAQSKRIGIYLYGSHQDVVKALRDKLNERYPHLRVVGWEPSIFRSLTAEEDAALVYRINDSGAGVVFLGLGCPLQEKFAHVHKNKIKAVQICVGAAFDFISGNKKIAPAWMQRSSLEWLFRLLEEPRRLWRRYLFTNVVFLSKLLLQVIRMEGFWLNAKIPSRK